MYVWHTGQIVLNNIILNFKKNATEKEKFLQFSKNESMEFNCKTNEWFHPERKGEIFFFSEKECQEWI